MSISIEVWGSSVSFPSGIRGTATAAQRFLCTLRSPGSLFCYVIRDKQLQKSRNRAVSGLRQPCVGQKLHEQGGYQL